jgi:hypothetical protein
MVMPPKKIKLTFPAKADPLFISMSKEVAAYVNRIGYCGLIHSHYQYDLSFCRGKEIWIFYSRESNEADLRRLGLKLLQYGAAKVQIQYFPIENMRHE